MKIVRFAVVTALAAAGTAACGTPGQDSTPSPTNSAELTAQIPTLELSGIVDTATFDLDDAIAIAIGSDDRVFGTSLFDDGSFVFDLPMAGAFEIFIANRGREGELRAIGQIVNPTSRGLSHAMTSKKGGKLALGLLRDKDLRQLDDRKDFGKLDDGKKWRKDIGDVKSIVRNDIDLSHICKAKPDISMWPQRSPGDAWDDLSLRNFKGHFDRSPMKNCVDNDRDWEKRGIRKDDGERRWWRDDDMKDHNHHDNGDWGGKKDDDRHHDEKDWDDDRDDAKDKSDRDCDDGKGGHDRDDHERD